MSVGNAIKKVRAVRYPQWTQDAERLLLYLDIMGFSARVLSKKHNEVKEDLLQFKNAWERRMKPLLKGDYLKFVQFSDSILVVANGVDYKMFNLITKAAVCIMQEAFEHNIPLKGVLAKGEFTYDTENQFYYGRPLVEAYQLHDQIYFYGIVVHHSAEKIVKQYADESNPYGKSQVNIKSGKTSHYHLMWYLLNKGLTGANMEDFCGRWLNELE